MIRKKLNNKGFTLVELLAVIVILAIVVGISIPLVLNAINGAKKNSLNVIANSADKWLTEQTQLYSVDTNSVDGTFKISIINDSSSGLTLKSTTEKDLLEAMGLKDVSEAKITKNTNGSYCVEITKIPTTSKYYNTDEWEVASGATVATYKTTLTNNKSDSCS